MTLSLVLSLFSCHTAAEEKIGVVLLHGKQGGGLRDNSLDSLQRKLLEAGALVIRPELPWSRNRYIEGDWNQAMSEIALQVRKLNELGATRVALVGHSIGSPASLSFAVKYPDKVHALGLIAPGHIPYYFSQCIPFAPIRMCSVRDGVDRARKEIEAGDATGKNAFPDINQGSANVVWMSPKDYFSYFDPAGDAEMSITAAKVPATVPVLYVIGNKDPLFEVGRQYVFEKLPANTKNQYLEVSGNHISTPAVAADQIVNWIKAVLIP